MIGVYFLKQDNEIIYVGQSIDIERRIKEHRATDKVFDDYSVMECKEELLDTTEEAFILQHNPIFNIRKAVIYSSGALDKHLIVRPETHALVKAGAKEERLTIDEYINLCIEAQKKG